MNLRRWQAISLAALIPVLAVSRTAWAQDADEEETPRILVRLDDKAGVQGTVLKFARARATEVFRMSGVDVEWIDGETANRLKILAPYTILILAEPPATLRKQARYLGTDVMGQALPPIGRAYLYYDRILNTLAPSRDTITTLGDVMAHELGHLILPPGHSNVGIMRPTINMMSRRVETFTEVEGIELRATLRERARTSNLEPRMANGENLNTN